jgi:flagellar biosynthetic protein FlhB/flagellar biosynthetic protein FliR/FlhB
MSQMEKTEKATPHKLNKAREQGQVAKSTDFISSLTLLTSLILITALWSTDLQKISSNLSQLLISSHDFHFTLTNITQLFNTLLLSTVSMLLPLGLAIIITVILSTVVQTGFVWSTKPLTPDFKRLNFIQGFKRFFSIKLLFDGGKQSFKLVIVCSVLVLSFKQQLPTLLDLTQISTKAYPATLMHCFLTLGFQLFLVLFVASLIDLLFTRWKYGKDNRMSKQEVKDEHKQREGDPKIKAKIKQLQREMRAKADSIKNVKQADVVITNPTHLAIALKYNRHTMPAPKVICKAQGDMVDKVKAIARRHGISVVEDKPFARALFKAVKLNQTISEEFFPVAASILRQVYQKRGEAL